MNATNHTIESRGLRRTTGLVALVLAVALSFLALVPGARPASASAGTDTLSSGEMLYPGQRLVAANGSSVLLMQDDGNLVLIATGNRPLWASNTGGKPGTVLMLQGDGNLVLIAPGNHPIWATNTPGNANSILRLQTDGNLVLIAPGNRPVWATSTQLPQLPSPPPTPPPAAGNRRPASTLSLSARGEAFIKRLEGYRPKPYNDTSGYCTVGYGHLLKYRGCTGADQPITKAQADSYFRADAARFVAQVRKQIGATPLSTSEFDSLVSFAYNAGSLYSSIVKPLKTSPPAYGNVPGAIRRTVHPDSPLVGRRAAEAALFGNGQY